MTFEIEGFTPLGVLGRGGFGTVHRAADDAHGREVAVKVLGRVTDDSARRRFDRERRAMGTLSGHPAIGIVYTSGFTADEEPYIVMEMIRGGSLADRLDADGALPAPEVVDLGATLAGALHHAHQGGVLHLDLKPENILMSRFGTPKIVDFGIAAIVDDESATSTIRATPAYADPQVLNGSPGTAQSDVYGLAATLFTLLHGSAPYSHGPGGLYRVMQRVALDPVPEIDRVDVSDELAELIHRSMAKDPSERPTSMKEFEQLLRQVEPEPVTQRRPSPRRIDRSTTPGAVEPRSAAPNDDWPGQGERPRLPGAVDSSNPVRRPAADQPPPSSPARSSPAPSSPAPSSPAGSQQRAVVAPHPTSAADDLPPRVEVRPRPQGRRTNTTTTTVAAVLATVAVVFVAVAVFVVVRSDRPSDQAPVNSIAAGTATPPAAIDDLAARVTDDGTLPDVVGLRADDASAVVRDSGFDVSVPAHCFDSVESQSPAAGDVAEDDAIVTLQFPPCVVPDFVGLRLPEARRIVEDVVVVGLRINWPAHCDDVVLDQSVAPGTVVDPGTMVRLSLEQDCGG